MTTIIICIAAFLGVAALVGGVAIMFRPSPESAVQDRLEALTSGKSAAAVEMAKKEKSVLAHPLDDAPHVIEEFFSRFLNLRLLLQQADLAISPVKFVLLSAVLAAAGAVAYGFSGLSVMFTPLVALVAGILPLFWVLFKRKRRKAAFQKQLPEALELIARALRAGHSLGSGFQLVQSEMAEPISSELGRVYEEQNLGIAMEEALNSMCDRVPNVDLRFFATAIILQRQTGGDLAEILDKIGHLIRERFKIWGQIQALTGEGRLSGIVLLALPPVLFLVMYRLNPKYVLMLFEDPLGKQMLAVAIALQVVGALVIRKIVDIKV